MNDTVQYAMASFLLLIVGFLAACAGLWLAMQHEWAGAAGAATVALAAAVGLIGVGDRVALQRNSTADMMTVGHAVDPDETQRILGGLKDKGIVEDG